MIIGLIFAVLVIIFVAMSYLAAAAKEDEDYKNMGKGQVEDNDEDPSIYFDLIDDDENNKTE